jgi:hypothetical protein
MKKIAIAAFVVAMVAGAGVGVHRLCAQDAPPMPEPTKEHQWLSQLAGEWETEAEIFMEPGKPPMKAKGTESGRMIGGFWFVAETKGTFMDKSMSAVLTLGWDAQKKTYVGTWVDSMMPYMWKYEGSVDASGKVLTLNTEGPNPAVPGKLCKFKEVIQIKDKDTRAFSSSMQMDDGSWMKIMNVTYRRKK